MSYLRLPVNVVPARNPLRAVFRPFLDVCLTLCLFTDLAYWWTSFLMWQHFSAWLLLAGLVFGVVAAIGGALDFLFHAELRANPRAWLHAAGTLILLILAVVNSLVHARDGWIAVVPTGLVLSAIGLLVIVLLALLERQSVQRYGGANHGQ